MNDQLKVILLKAKLNFAILASILTFAVVGKFTSPEFTNTVFVTADQLVSDLYIVFIAITLGAFSPNFKLVAFGSIGVFIVITLCSFIQKFKLVPAGSIDAFIGVAILIQMGLFTYLTIDYVFAILIVILGFASIANLYRHYREFRF